MSATDLSKEFIIKRWLVLWLLFAMMKDWKHLGKDDKLHKEVLHVFLYCFNEGTDSVTE